MSNPTITWTTNSGTVGTYPAQIAMSVKVQATVTSPYIITKYEKIAGDLPLGLSFRSDGKIYGTPNVVSKDTLSTIVVRAYAEYGTNVIISDRTFTITITGAAIPTFTIPSGTTIATIFDSEWQSIPITYNNPISTNEVTIRVLQGELPPGLEMNTSGLIRGYAEPPVTTDNFPEITTIALSTNNTTGYVTVLSTYQFVVNRPIIFSGTSFGGLVSEKVYYIKEIINSTQITITTVIGGDAITLTTGTGYMDVTLPSVAVDTPTQVLYTFTLDLISAKGNDRAVYYILVTNQQYNNGDTPLPSGTRKPTILNTRPATYNIISDTTNYGYYVLPPASSVSIPGETYPSSELAYIGDFQSDNYFSFHLLGYDFDAKTLTYLVSGLPAWASYDSVTGWIYGNPIVSNGTIEQFSFEARVTKTVGATTINSDTFNFTFKINNNVDGNIEWITDTDLGTLYNASICYKNIEAVSDVPLLYELTPNSNLPPPNLTMKLDGHIEGIVSYQPEDIYLEKNTTTPFTFTVRAYNPDLLKPVAVQYLLPNVRYFITKLGSTNFTSVGATQVTAGNLEIYEKYLIKNIGNTDFQFIGANLVTAGLFVVGKEYIIQSVGTTDFTLLGASTNAVNTIFTATDVGVGTGKAYETLFTSTGKGNGTGITIKQSFIATGSTIGTGSTETYIVTADKQFTLNVLQYYDSPTDNLYIKCTPNNQDRDIIESLLTNNVLIPTNYLFRPDDVNFGKAKDITYAHAYGINTSSLDQYIAAVQKNHYWRDVTLGELSTAVARDENNNIIYEVVYSNIIDNLMVYDPAHGVDYRYATSIPEMIRWPRFIDLNLGPWYTSNTEIYTSWQFNTEAVIITDLREYALLTQDGRELLINGGIPMFYTSLTPGYARTLYPNSLDNMRLRVQQELGANNNFNLLPLWMTSQQKDGNTLGFTPAWVICYTKPVEPVIVTSTQTIANAELGIYAILLDSITGLVINRPIVFTGNTFGNIVSGQVYYIKSIGVPGYPNSITVSTSIGGPVYRVYNESNSSGMIGAFDPVSYAEIIKERIQNNNLWPFKLNQIDFQIDRFTVDKQLTYDYLTQLDPGTWADYPSATPPPDPLDSKNFYVIFPRKTILPDRADEYLL